MYQVAICEDEPVMRNRLYEFCTGILTKMSVEHKISVFSSAEEFEEASINSGSRFNVLLLDIELGGKSGMELAHEMRERGNRISIIFITGSEEYLREGYSIQPIHYLLKPVSKEKVAEALKVDLDLNYHKNNIVLQKGAKTVILPADDIVYIESFDHKVIVHSTCEEHVFKWSLSEIAKKLPENMFCRVHNSYIINMKHIVKFLRSEIVLSEGSCLPVGRKYYEAVQKSFVHYINLQGRALSSVC